MELSKNYIPETIENHWYAHWKEQGYFRSIPDERKPYTIVIPPPNVTGVLHMGHTLNETIQDILVRRARMEGYNACWVPGSDHASIATEAKVVQMLQLEQGINKYQLGREEFLRFAWAWKEKYDHIIYNQIQKLGCSCDWDRTTFTLDPHYSKAVITVFIQLYREGLLYRGARMIHWDPVAKTALSDEEVEYRETESSLYYVIYELENGAGQVSVATTRPETILGDTALCVNPNDKRYKSLIGKKALVPLLGRTVPILSDEYVDPEFGTGCLKITPAHDMNDYRIGLKYGLPIIDILNEDGTISEVAQFFSGMDRFQARKLIVEELRHKGLLERVEQIRNKNGYSQRTNAIVEPRISTQWFLSMDQFAGPALQAVMNDRVRIHPSERFLNTYKFWMEHVRDWCISRQLWWGHRIPVWYDPKGEVYVAQDLEGARREWERNHPGMPFTEGTLRQDEDVLDTWFSSWIWPIEVFRGITEPDNQEYRYYFPTSVLVTGQDILFFWVARMIMAGLNLKNEVPFRDVYFTGMVRDRQGKKMSKSLGNSPELLALIKRYGADAVRFGIMISSPAGNDLLFDEGSCEQGSFFCNKMWNALKLIKLWEQKGVPESEPAGLESFHAANWFQNRLNQVSLEVEGDFCNFRLSEALKKIYRLIWDDFCSWYLEWVKPERDRPVSRFIQEKTIAFFERLMQLLHPFMPFITEEIYHGLQERNFGDDLMICPYQTPAEPDVSVLEQGALAQELISTIRDIRKKHGLNSKESIGLWVMTSMESVFPPIREIVSRQVMASVFGFCQEPVGGAFRFVVGKNTYFMNTRKALDAQPQKERIEKDLQRLQGFLRGVERKLSDKGFTSNARPEVIVLEHKKKLDAEEKIRVLEESLKNL